MGQWTPAALSPSVTVRMAAPPGRTTNTAHSPITQDWMRSDRLHIPTVQEIVAQVAKASARPHQTQLLRTFSAFAGFDTRRTINPTFAASGVAL